MNIGWNRIQLVDDLVPSVNSYYSITLVLFYDLFIQNIEACIKTTIGSNVNSKNVGIKGIKRN